MAISRASSTCPSDDKRHPITATSTIPRSMGVSRLTGKTAAPSQQVTSVQAGNRGRFEASCTSETGVSLDVPTNPLRCHPLCPGRHNPGAVAKPISTTCKQKGGRSPISQLLEGSQRSLAELPTPVLQTLPVQQLGLESVSVVPNLCSATLKTVSEEPNNLDDVRIADDHNRAALRNAATDYAHHIENQA